MTERHAPIDTGGLKRMLVTGSLGCPIWLHDLLRKSDIKNVTAIELGDGGRGVRTPDGWVSVDELQERASTQD